jgi:exodeoxyribonuclease V alpha subunit
LSSCQRWWPGRAAARSWTGSRTGLAHAYAVTIHRSQGSEYPAVVIPLTTSSWTLLQRNLLCTGITRARKLVVLAGSRRALAAAIRTKGAGRRHTALTHRLHPRLAVGRGSAC